MKNDLDIATPYYAVIFSSQRTQIDSGYAATSDLLEELAKEEEGFLGIESFRQADGRGVTISYWKDTEAIARWRDHVEHKKAKEQGRKAWYESYTIRIAKVEKAYVFSKKEKS